MIYILKTRFSCRERKRNGNGGEAVQTRFMLVLVSIIAAAMLITPVIACGGGGP